MSDDKRTWWGIHTLDDNLFLNENVIALGWKEMGDLSLLPADREAFKDKYIKTYPESKKGAIPTSTGMLYRFCHEVQIGDYIVFPSKSDRMVNIGEVTGPYTYKPGYHYAQQHSVKWLKHIPRTSFSQAALYEIGSAMSFFTVKNYADEFQKALEKGFKPKMVVSPDREIVAITADDILENTKDFILKEISRNLKGYSLEGLVADLLQAMGYRTTISPQGGDSGIDITAYKDELPPRILVQVKSQDGDIKETTIQSLKGVLVEGDYGLFVTLSNYTKNAKAFLDKTHIIRGINGTELVELILKYYDSLSEEYKDIIPLKMVYIPVPKEPEE